MEHMRYKLALIVGIPSLSLLILLIIFILIFLCRKMMIRGRHSDQPESGRNMKLGEESEDDERGNLLRFRGGEDLTAQEILEAPGVVIGKSSYATLYKASLILNSRRRRTESTSVKVLRFIRPACAENGAEVIELLGSIRHSNLVPLHAFYAGRRGEKLLVYPFYGNGNLAHFITGGNDNLYKWPTIYRISVGIAKGLDHLHTGLQSPIIHGNLKSKNVLLDNDYQPWVSDFGLHHLLNPASKRELFKASVAQGYNYKHHPEHNTMTETDKEKDIYSLGVIFLELVTRKEPIIEINPGSGPNREVIHLAKFVREALIEHDHNHNVPILYHQDIVLGQNDDEIGQILKFFDLALACSSPSPSPRPCIKQVLEKLKEIDG